MFCLSKGLGAPVGSLVVATREAIDRARLYRKRLGGGMRQAGVLAAAGLIALEESPAGLAADHANARYLANRLSQMPPIKLDAARVMTNIIIFDISGLGLTTAEFSMALKEKGILANGINATHMRMLTHSDVSRQDCETAANAVEQVLAGVGTLQAGTSV
jgi:threonine aldolase